MKKWIRLILVCVCLVAALGTYATAMAIDIGYTGETVLSGLEYRLFNGVARYKVADGGYMSVNTTPGGSKPGWVKDAQGNLLTGNILFYNCRNTTATQTNCCDNNWVGDNQQSSADFKDDLGVEDDGYYLYIFNTRLATTNFSMTWSPH